METGRLFSSPALRNASLVPTKIVVPKKKEVSIFAKRYLKDDSARPGDITIDHCYSKNWNSHSDQSHAQTAKYISWLNSEHRKSSPAVDNDEVIDIESVDKAPESEFDHTKANTLMTECERHMKIVRPAGTQHADEPIDRSEWSTAQNKVFNRVYKALAATRLSKLAHSGADNEPILRRLSVDKNSRRIRHIFSSAYWDQSLLSWLHSTCMDNLPNAMLSDYLEVLQTLKDKVPELINRMITGSEHHQKMNNVGNQAFDLLIKRPWDPITAMPSLTNLDKLPKNPLLVLVPQFGLTDNINPSAAKHRRHQMWSSQFSNMGRVLSVPPSDVSKMSDRWEQFDAMVGITKACIIQAKETYPGKPIVLLGWNFGALLAIYVSSIQRVNAVIALGYPLLGLSGLRGDADDVTVDSTTPILFVVGEHAQTCPIDDLENMRERMRADNELIVVAGANDKLNINFKTKRDRLLTQAIVDRCIQEEIRSYLERLLSVPTQLVQSPTISNIERLKKKKSQALNLTGRKIITTIKRMDTSMVSVPKKRKSPSKESRARKQMKSFTSVRSNPLPSEEEQLAAISSITSGNNASDPLNLSSSSHGSLTSLQPHRLRLPNLSLSSDSLYGVDSSPRDSSIRHAYQGIRLDTPPVQQFAAHVNKKHDAQLISQFPAYVQLSGQHAGQGVAITMEKARELLSMGMLRNFNRSKSVEEGVLSGYETTRRLLSLPVGSAVCLSPATNAVPLAKAISISDANPVAIGQNRSTNLAQIRTLLSTDGRLMLPNTLKPAVVPRLASPVIKKEVVSIAVSQGLSPGQSLIRKLQTSSAPSSSCRQILVKPRDIKRTVSVVLNSSSTCPSPAPGTTSTSTTPSAVIINPNTRNYSNLASTALPLPAEEGNSTVVATDCSLAVESTPGSLLTELNSISHLVEMAAIGDIAVTAQSLPNDAATRVVLPALNSEKQREKIESPSSFVETASPSGQHTNHMETINEHEVVARHTEDCELMDTAEPSNNVRQHQLVNFSTESSSGENTTLASPIEPTMNAAEQTTDSSQTSIECQPKLSHHTDAKSSSASDGILKFSAENPSARMTSTPSLYGSGKKDVSEISAYIPKAAKLTLPKSSIDCLDNEVTEILSPNACPTISAHCSQYFTDVDFPPHIVDDIIVPAASMFNPETEDPQCAGQVSTNSGTKVISDDF